MQNPPLKQNSVQILNEGGVLPGKSSWACDRHLSSWCQALDWSGGLVWSFERAASPTCCQGPRLTLLCVLDCAAQLLPLPEDLKARLLTQTVKVFTKVSWERWMRKDIFLSHTAARTTVFWTFHTLWSSSCCSARHVPSNCGDACTEDEERSVQRRGRLFLLWEAYKEEGKALYICVIHLFSPLVCLSL